MTKLKILTLDDEAFAARCRELEALCTKFNPDLVIGIACGGPFVANCMFSDVRHAVVKCQRAGTATKRKGVFKRLLRSLPRPVADLARKAEARMLAKRRVQIPQIELEVDVIAAIANARRVLVVDDAVDSGATLAGTLRAIRSVRGERQVASAVITVTTQNPVVRPDYAVFDNRTLIRFPWSLDA